MRSYKKVIKSALLICMFAASSMAFAAENEGYEQYSETEEQVELTEDDMVYVMPTLAVDAERTSYHALISRPQDEVSAKQIEGMPTHNPVEMLMKRNSSVSLGGGLGGATVTPKVRGLSSRYTTVTVDGIPVNTPWNWSSPLSGFPLNRLKKVTLSNTGSALVYGQNAVAGAVNFSLPTGRDNQGFTMVHEVGGEGTQHQEFSFGFANDTDEHMFAIFNDKYGGDRRFQNGSIMNNRRDNRMFYYKGSIDLKNGWTFDPMLMHNEGSITVGDAWKYKQRFDPWKMSLSSYALTKDLGNESNIILRYTKYNDYSAAIDYDDNALTQINAANTAGEEPTNVDMETIEALYNFKANDKNYINVGVQNQKVKDSHDSVRKDMINKELDNTSFFVADSIKATDKLNIHAVVRSDEDYEGERDTSYSLNTNYDLTDKTSIGLGYSSTVSIPNLKELYRAKAGKPGKPGKPGRPGEFGNPDLKNEKSDSYEIRLAHKINDKWGINLTAYHYDIDDMITTKTASDLGLTGKNWGLDRDGKTVTLNGKDYVHTNVDEAELQGIELGINGKLNDKLDMWLSYTDFDKAEEKQAGVTNDINSIPDYRATMGFEYTEGKTTASIAVSHQGDFKKAKPTDPEIDSSTTADLYIREQCRKDFAIYLKVANIGNDKNVILSRSAPSRSNKDQYYYEDGRVVTVGAEIKF